jgi:hypothetical protein
MQELAKYPCRSCSEDLTNGAWSPTRADHPARDAGAPSPHMPNRPVFSQGNVRVKSSWVAVMVKDILITAALLLAALYAGDYIWLRIRVSHPQAGQAFGAVQFYWATPIKGGKDEIFFDQPQTETCTRSLFPHLGFRPCWYSSGQNVREIR